MAKTAACWTQDPREALRATAGFDVAALDPSATPGWRGNKAEALSCLADRGALLSELQERLYAQGKADGQRSILVIAQGIDTAGKSGVARHVLSYVDPQGVWMRSFGVPTAEERAHHYLWRIERGLPRPGLIGVFDRSHYEDVLVVRVDNLVSPQVWEPRYEEINQWEANLAESGTTIIKLALMIDRDEQGVRLMDRLDRPDKRWKFNPGDIDTRLKWDDYQRAYQDVFAETSTPVAPWYVIPANRRWYSRLAIIEILTRTLLDMDLHWPQAEYDVAEQRTRLAASMSEASLRTSAQQSQSRVVTALKARRRLNRLEAASGIGGTAVGTSAELLALRSATASIQPLEEAVEAKQVLLADRRNQRSGRVTPLPN